VCLLALSASAQTYTGSIEGRVTDASGSAVPKADVKITEISTNTTLKTVTNDSGDYIVSYLKPGTYSIEFHITGFKEMSQKVLLQLDQQLRIDPVLQVGDSSDKIMVAASTLQVNLVSPEIGTIVGHEQLESLPQEATNGRGRSPFLLAKIVPGVTTNGTTFTNVNGFSLDGGRRETNEILVDGIPSTNPSDQTYTLTPSPDSLEEFKIITTPFSAEYGHTGGGVMIASTRGGTNEFHGSAYDLFRNRILNGRDFFSPVQGQAKYVQNDPGGNLGGPMYIPKLYDGRNKTFFYIDYNVTLASQGGAYSQLVPTDLQKEGNFSQTFAGNQLVVIYDPATAHLGPDGKTMVRNPFPNNIIPATRIDPVAAQILKFYPEPNGSFNGNNYFITPPTQNKIWQYLGRIDQNFRANDRAFFRFGQYNPNTSATADIPNAANNTNSTGWTDTQAVLSETHVFSPTIVNDFRAGWVQEDNYTGVPGGSVPQLGLKGAELNTFPTIAVGQEIQLGAKNGIFHDRDRSWVFNEALTWQHGAHTIHIGGDFRRQMYNNYNPGKLSGAYQFTGTFTGVNANSTTSGFGLADLLLGAPAVTSFNINDYTYRLNINSAGAYIQDDYKVAKTFTVNLGLRWEFDGPYSEANNQFASFNPNLVNPQTGDLGTVEFAGRNGAPTHFSPNIYHDLLPRAGFVWNFWKKTVLRGGYGIYRLPSIGFASAGPISQYSASATFVSPDGGTTPAYYLANGVPPYSFNVDANGNPVVPASLTKPSSSPTELEMRTRTSYNQTWQIGFQQQFPGNWLAEADYVGTHGVKLPIAVPLNQLPPSEWGPGNLQSNRPFPQYLTVSYLENDGLSFYNALQASLQRPWRDGVLSLAYTWSKVTDYVDGPEVVTPLINIQNVYNLKLEHGLASYDVPQRFVANFVYHIPVGRSGRWLTGTPVLKDVIGGWELAGIIELQSGLPVAVTQSNNTGGFTGTQRPNQIASAPLAGVPQTLAEWFNTSAFTVAPAYTLGDEARYSFFGPGIENFDAAVMRNFPIKERVKLQLRGEFYNALNHPNFSNPNTTLGNVNYGKITSDVGPRTTELALRIFF
jgi:hypothetical protein